MQLLKILRCPASDTRLVDKSRRMKMSFVGHQQTIQDLWFFKPSSALQNSARASLCMFKICWATWSSTNEILSPSTYGLRLKCRKAGATNVMDCVIKASLTLCSFSGVRRGTAYFKSNTLPISSNVSTHVSIVFRDGTRPCRSTLKMTSISTLHFCHRFCFALKKKKSKQCLRDEARPDDLLRESVKMESSPFGAITTTTLRHQRPSEFQFKICQMVRRHPVYWI